MHRSRARTDVERGEDLVVALLRAPGPRAARGHPIEVELGAGVGGVLETSATGLCESTLEQRAPQQARTLHTGERGAIDVAQPVCMDCFDGVRQRGDGEHRIDLVGDGAIAKDSNVLYAHLGGQLALNAYSSIF